MSIWSSLDRHWRTRVDQWFINSRSLRAQFTSRSYSLCSPHRTWTTVVQSRLFTRWMDYFLFMVSGMARWERSISIELVAGRPTMGIGATKMSISSNVSQKRRQTVVSFALSNPAYGIGTIRKCVMELQIRLENRCVMMPKRISLHLKQIWWTTCFRRRSFRTQIKRDDGFVFSFYHGVNVVCWSWSKKRRRCQRWIPDCVRPLHSMRDGWRCCEERRATGMSFVEIFEISSISVTFLKERIVIIIVEMICPLCLPSLDWVSMGWVRCQRVILRYLFLMRNLYQRGKHWQMVWMRPNVNMSSSIWVNHWSKNTQRSKAKSTVYSISGEIIGKCLLISSNHCLSIMSLRNETIANCTNPSAPTLAEPPVLRQRLTTEIEFFVKHIHEQCANNDQIFHRRLSQGHNWNAINYAMVTGTGDDERRIRERPVSARDRQGRETPTLIIPQPASNADERQVTHLLSPRNTVNIDAATVRHKLQDFTLDDITKHLRAAISDDMKMLEQHVTYLHVSWADWCRDPARLRFLLAKTRRRGRLPSENQRSTSWTNTRR